MPRYGFALPGMLASVLLIAGVQAQAEDAQTKATELGNQGIALIQEGKIDEGIDQVREASRLVPEDGSWHMNLGSLLFQNGAMLYQNGQQEAAMPDLKEAQQELERALEMFTDKDNILKGQCAFLLGDLHYYVHKNPETARQFYQQALEYYPEHGGAQEALKNFPQ